MHLINDECIKMLRGGLEKLGFNDAFLKVACFNVALMQFTAWNMSEVKKTSTGYKWVGSGRRIVETTPAGIKVSKDDTVEELLWSEI